MAWYLVPGTKTEESAEYIPLHPIIDNAYAGHMCSTPFGISDPFTALNRAGLRERVVLNAFIIGRWFQPLHFSPFPVRRS